MNEIAATGWVTNGQNSMVSAVAGAAKTVVRNPGKSIRKVGLACIRHLIPNCRKISGQQPVGLGHQAIPDFRRKGINFRFGVSHYQRVFGGGGRPGCDRAIVIRAQFCGCDLGEDLEETGVKRTLHRWSPFGSEISIRLSGERLRG